MKNIFETIITILITLVITIAFITSGNNILMWAGIITLILFIIGTIAHFIKR